MGTRNRRYVIVGDGAAGITAAQQLRKADALADITIISDDPNPAYFRAALTNYLLGELREEQIWATTPNFYEQYRLHRMHARVKALDPRRSEVQLSHGGVPLFYDALLIASGARARSLHFDGSHLRGLMTLRTLQDCRAVMELATSSSLRQAVVVGGGPLALEWALGMHVRGIQVTVMLRGSSFMTGALDTVASDLLLARLRQAGIQVVVKDEVIAAVDRGDGHVGRVQTRSGLSLDCQLVATAIGVSPNTEWLANTGVQLSHSGAVVVNERMQTSLPNVFAAGDAAVFGEKPLQLWEPAQSQARVAAGNMAGQASRYEPGVHYMATRLFDLDFASLGSIDSAPGTEDLLDFPQGTGRISYRKLLIHQNRLVGALMLGHRDDRVRQNARTFKRLIDERVDVQAVKGRLLNKDFELAAWLDKQALVRREAFPVQAVVARAAEIRGTSVLEVSKLGFPSGLPVGSAGKTSLNLPAVSTGFSALSAPQAGMPGLAVSKDVQAATLALGTQILTRFNAREEAEAARAHAASPDRIRPAVLEGVGQRWNLDSPLCRIGRDPAGEVVLQDPAAETVHANVQRFGGNWYLRDLGSRAGTWVNDEPLNVPKRLSSSDRIRIGQTELVFFFLDSETESRHASVAAPTGPPQPRLQVRSGRSVGLTFPLTESSALVGQDPHCNIWLDDPALAPYHAQLQWLQNAWHVSSLGPNLWHNQQWLPQGSPVRLTEGDLLHLGAVSVLFTQIPISSQPQPRQSSPEVAFSRSSSGQKAAQMQAFEFPSTGGTAAPNFGLLRVHAGPGAGQAFPLAEYNIIGKGPQCQISLNAKGVAAQHLELHWVQGKLYARDLGSHAGTIKSGVPLGPNAVPTTSSDWFSLGPDIVLVYEDGA